MAMKTITVPVADDHAEPAWEVALLFPAQGEWSEDDYLWLTDHTKCLAEFTEGRIEVLPVPTDEHQRMVLFLYRALYAFLAARGIGKEARTRSMAFLGAACRQPRCCLRASQ